jgi:hypothetical protein
MKIRKKNQAESEPRELLLKEYFLNAYLIALLKQVSAGVRRRNDKASAALPNDVAGGRV